MKRALLALLLASTFPAVHAEIQTYSFKAIITTLYDYRGENLPSVESWVPGVTIDQKDIVEGTLTYDPAAHLTWSDAPLTAEQGDYRYSSPHLSYQFTVLGSGLKIDATAPMLAIHNEAARDGWPIDDVGLYTPYDSNSPRQLTSYIRFSDEGAQVLTGGHVPANLLDKYDWAFATMLWNPHPSNPYSLERLHASAYIYELNLVGVSPVPEPASTGMLLAGLAAIGWRLRRRC